MTKAILGFCAILGMVVGCAASNDERVGTSEEALRSPAKEVGPETAGNPGQVLEEDGNCSVSCGEGTFACCNENGGGADTCVCWPNGSWGARCDVGGQGAASCSSPSTSAR